MREILSRPSVVAFVSLLVVASFAFAGSLTPLAAPGSTMYTLSHLWGTIASTSYDSSGITANRNGSLLAAIKYIDSQLGWASASNNLSYLGSGNVGIGDSSPETKFEVVGTASVSSLTVGGAAITPSGWTDGGANVYLTTSTDNVGIGTSTPAFKLEIGTPGDINLASPGAALYFQGRRFLHADTINVFGTLQWNTAVGVDALANIDTTGFPLPCFFSNCVKNVAIGWKAMYATTSGAYNTAVGASALAANITGSNNVALGTEALLTATGSGNTAVGFRGMSYRLGGSFNTALGYGSMMNDSGSNNTAVGVNSLAYLQSGVYNTSLGVGSGTQASGSYNVFLGSYSGASAPGTTLLNSVIVLGHYAYASASHQFVVGGRGVNGYVDEGFFGNSVASTSPISFRFNATAGQGTDVAGANLTLAGGRGTGSGIGGSLLFQTAPAGATGNAQNALVTRLTIDSTGLANFANNVSVSGNFELTGYVSSNLTPTVTDTYSLGTSALRWANLFATNASVSGNLEVSGTASVSQLYIGGSAYVASPWTRSGSNTYLANSGDNVGIGDSSPETKFEVVGTASASRVMVDYGSFANPSITFASDSYVGLFYEEAANSLVVKGWAGLTLLTSDNWIALDSLQTTILKPVIMFEGGSAAIPQLSFANDGNNDSGLYWSNEDELGFSTGGVARLLLANSGASLSGNFDPTADITYRLGSPNVRWLNLFTYNASVSNVFEANIASVSQLYVGGTAVVPSGWTDDGTVVRLTISTDNVGIGTTAAPYKLVVANGDVNIASAGAYLRMAGLPAVRYKSGGIGGNWFFGDTQSNPTADSALDNVAVGGYTLRFLTSGDRNVAVGTLALGSMGSKSSENVAVGYKAGAELLGDGNTALGTQALWFWYDFAQKQQSNYNTAIGYDALVGSGTIRGSYNTGLGAFTGPQLAVWYGSYNTMLGAEAGQGGSFGGHHNIFIGDGTSYLTSYAPVASVSYSIALGSGATIYASHQFVLGGDTGVNYVSEGFFGSGVSASAPTAFRFNGSGGSGTNVAGANLTLAGGRGTGTGAGGSLLFQTAPAGATGNAQNALVTRLTIDSTGLANFANNVSVSGNFELTGFVSSNLTPTVTDTYSLGTSALRWANLFTTNASVSNNLEVSGTASVSQLYIGGTVFNPAVAGGWTDGGANVYLTTSTDNVGIGTTAPAFKLEIGTPGDINIASPGAALYMQGQRVLHIDSCSGMGAVWNTALGVNALANIQTDTVSCFGGSFDNVAIGHRAMFATTTGRWNTAVGGDALYSNTTGMLNVAVGKSALGSSTTGLLNTAVGYVAMQARLGGQQNTALGYAAMMNDSGSYNVAIGDQTLNALQNGLYNTAVGSSAGRYASGSYNTLLGAYTQGVGPTTVLNSVIALGTDAYATASHQFVVGGRSLRGYVDEGFFGNSVASTSPISFRFNATAGQGTDVAGANLTLAGGRGTGMGAGGSLLFQTAPAGATGNAQNALVTRLTIDSTGLANFANNVSVSGNFGPTSTNTYDLGSQANRWRSIYVSSGSVHIGRLGNEGVISYQGSGDVGITFNKNLLPTADATFSLGLGTNQWTNIFSQNVSISGVLELTGTNALVINGEAARGVTSNSLDFDELLDSLTLDADTTIALNGNSLTIGPTVVSPDGATFSTPFEVTAYASVSRLYGAGLTNCTGGGKVLYNATTGRFSCGTDAGASGLTIDVSDTVTEQYTSSISFAFGQFNVAFSTPNALITLNWGAGGPASLSQDEQVTGHWVFQGGASISSTLEIAGAASASAFFGGGLTDCDQSGKTLWYDVTTGTFTCVTVTAADITMSRIGYSTFSSVQDLQNTFHSSGWTSGGDVADLGGGTVSVTAGTGLIRATTADNSTVSWFDWVASTSVTIPSGTTRYIGIDYNSGAPKVVVRSDNQWNYRTNFSLAVVTNEAGSLHISTDKTAVGDHAAKMIWREYETMPFAFDMRTGGLELGETGTRNVTLSAGAVWDRLNRYAIAAIDTSGAGTFDRYYRDGGSGWTEEPGQVQWPNDRYDDGSGTLAAVPTNNYAVLWFYVMSEGELAMVYGRGHYDTANEAQTEMAPMDLPPSISVAGRIVGRIIFKKSQDTAVAIQSAFEQSFNPIFQEGLMRIVDSNGDVALVSSLSFSASGFNVSNGMGTGRISLDYTNGPASRSIAQNITAPWTFSGVGTGLTVTTNASVSSDLEVTGSLQGGATTLGTLTVTGQSLLANASVSGNLEITGGMEVMGLTTFSSLVASTASLSGTLEAAYLKANTLLPSTGNLLLLQAPTSVSGAFEASGYASASAMYGAGLGNCDLTTGKLVWNNGVFQCGSDSGAVGSSIYIEENGTLVQSTATHLDFAGGQFTPVASGSTEVVVKLDWGAGGPASRSLSNVWSAFNAFGAGASVTGAFEVSGAASSSQLFGAGLTSCGGAGQKLLWNNGQFSCGTDSTGSSGALIGISEVGGTFANRSSISFSASGFTVNNTGLASVIGIDWTNGPASRSIPQNITAPWTFSAPNTALIVTTGASVSGDFEVSGGAILNRASVSGALEAATLKAGTVGSDTNALLITANASMSQSLEISGFASTSKLFGAGLTTCTGTFNVLRYDAATGWFSCGTEGGGLRTEEGEVTIVANNNSLNFSLTDFALTASTTQTNIALDYANSGIARLNQNQTVTGSWIFTNASISGTLEAASVKTDSLTNSTGTLSIGAFTLTGVLNANAQNISGIGQLGAANASVSGTLEALLLKATTLGSDVGLTINPTTQLTLAPGTLLQINTTASTSSSIEVSGYASASRIFGAGLTDCDGAGEKLLWTASGSNAGRFTCSSDLGAGQTATFTDTTTEAASFTSAADIWDGTFPNLTVNSSAARVLISVVIRGTSQNANDMNPVFTLRRNIGANPTCSSTQVGSEFAGSFLTATNQSWGSAATFLDTGTFAAGNNVRYTVCTTATGLGNGNTDSVTVTLMQVGGADLAEHYYAEDLDIEPGTVVAIDPTAVAGIRMTSGSYDASTLGVVSTEPGMLLDDGIGAQPGRFAVPVALAGRIPVKVTSANGTIKAGDWLTSSQIPGVAMKATAPGPVIGQALHDFGDTSGSGLVMMFVRGGWYDGSTVTAYAPKAPVASEEVVSFGQFIINALSELYDIVIERGILRVAHGIFGTVEVQNGVTTYDEDTGEPYCIKVKSGQLVSVPGACVSASEEPGQQTTGEETGSAVTPPTDDTGSGTVPGDTPADTDAPAPVSAVSDENSMPATDGGATEQPAESQPEPVQDPVTDAGANGSTDEPLPVELAAPQEP